MSQHYPIHAEQYGQHQWWLDGRSNDDAHMGCLMRNALKHKAQMCTDSVQWMSIGPSNLNGRVKCIAVSVIKDEATGEVIEHIVYAGAASGGVWRGVKADDNKWSWSTTWKNKWKNGDLVDCLSIGALAVHPENPKIIYAGTGEWAPGDENLTTYPGVGLIVSYDGGQSWGPPKSCESKQDKCKKLKSRRISQVLVSPNEKPKGKNIIYVAGDKGFQKSEDGGCTWEMFLPEDVKCCCKNDQCCPENDNHCCKSDKCCPGVSDAVFGKTVVNEDGEKFDTICINVCNDAIYKTIDSGKSWERLSDGPTNEYADWVRLAFSSQTKECKDKTILTDTLFAKRNGTIFKYAEIETQPKPPICPDKKITIEKFWTSLPGHQGGASGYPEWCNLIAVHPTNPDILFAGGIEFYRTTNGGKEWSKNRELHVDHHRAIVIPSTQPAQSDKLPYTVYTCNDGGVYRLDEDGEVFDNISDGLDITQFYHVGTYQSKNGDDIIIGGGTQDLGTNILRTTKTKLIEEIGNADPSSTQWQWENILEHDGGYFVVDPRDRNIMYAESQWTRIKKSIDGGRHWRESDFGLYYNRPWIGVIAMDPKNHDVLFTGTEYVYRTTDGCETPWELISIPQKADKPTEDIPAKTEFFKDGFVKSIAIPSKNAKDEVFVATNTGRIWHGKKDDKDTFTWETVLCPTDNNNTCNQVVVCQEDNQYIVAVFGGPQQDGCTGGLAGFVKLSRDNGKTWKKISGVKVKHGEGAKPTCEWPKSALPQISINTAIFHPTDKNIIYVGTDVGVFKGKEEGDVWNWEILSEDIPNAIVTRLALLKDTNILIAATYGRGMYACTI
ncbi:MAG: hypothetical protein AAF639_38225 [Chloroflexota bacterium]